MTMIDKLATFCTATSVVATENTTTLIGSTIDTLTLTSRPGAGQPVYLVILTTTEITTAGSTGYIQFKLSSDATTSIATNGTATDICTALTYITDDSANNSPQLNAGGIIVCQPIDLRRAERHLGILCAVTTTATNAGAITAFLTLNPEAYLAYPNAI